MYINPIPVIMLTSLETIVPFAYMYVYSTLLPSMGTPINHLSRIKRDGERTFPYTRHNRYSIILPISNFSRYSNLGIKHRMGYL